MLLRLCLLLASVFLRSEAKSFSITVTLDMEYSSKENVTSLSLKKEPKSVFEKIDKCKPLPRPDFSKTASRVSELKCKQYIWEMIERQEQYDLGCTSDKYGEDLETIQGRRTEKLQYAHMAALGWPTKSRKLKYIFLCDGSLISERFILTGAHCLYIRYNIRRSVPTVALLGSRYTKYSPDEVPKIFNIVWHIPYLYYERSKHYHDIALLQLEQVITFTKYIQPICLSDVNSNGGGSKMKTVTGWRYLSDRQNNELERELKYSSVDMVEPKVCDEDKPRTGTWNGLYKQICGRSTDCNWSKNDLDGPLQYLLANSSTEGVIQRMIGIAAVSLSGKPTSTKCSPIVYTSVSSYIKWIENIVWPDEVRQWKETTSLKNRNTLDII